MHDPSTSERTQRVRIGLTGLAFVFLLVIIGTAVSRSGDELPAGQAPTDSAAQDIEPEEPLARIGVAPGQSTTTNDAAEPPPKP